MPAHGPRLRPVLAVSLLLVGSSAASAQGGATSPSPALVAAGTITQELPAALGPDAPAGSAGAEATVTAATQPGPIEMAVQQIGAGALVPAFMRDQPKAPRGVLPSMYAGFATLQALDAHSTLRALDGGAHEQNPLMRWAADRPVALVSLKAAATAGTVFVAEKIRKKHPKRAVAFMAAINAAYAFVVVRNYRAVD